jgi:signal transduction histidine kinase
MSDSVIKRLRRKIVLVSIVAVFVSLLALIFAINYAHYRQVDASLHSALAEIASESDMGLDAGQRFQGGAGNQQVPRQDVGSGQQVSGQDGVQAPDSELDAMKHVEHGGRKSARTQYGSRFFCVLVAEDGGMYVKNHGDGELTDEYARQLVQSALDSGKSEGYLDDYKFLVDESGAQKRVLFLDCTTDLEALRQLLVVGLIVGGCAFVIASFFMVRLSCLIVRPLEESARKQKQFVADAGHELKTPLSVIATNMDILEVDLADQPEEQEWIDSTNRQVTNMRRLVNDLIVLSKMEERENDIVLSEVSLSDIAYECIQTFSQIAIAQGKELVPSIDEGVCVRGDEPAIRQLMQIFVDNAIKYSTGDGTILVEVEKAGRTTSFATRNDWVHDVEMRELPTLFDRFVRGERSRDRSGGKAGYGLGLSIARAIAEKNGLKLEVDEDDAGRIVFRALFPAR